jgi:hypothetical protein
LPSGIAAKAVLTPTPGQVAGLVGGARVRVARRKRFAVWKNARLRQATMRGRTSNAPLPPGERPTRGSSIHQALIDVESRVGIARRDLLIGLKNTTVASQKRQKGIERRCLGGRSRAGSVPAAW